VRSSQQPGAAERIGPSGYRLPEAAPRNTPKIRRMKSAARFIDANTTCSLSKPTFNLAAKAKEPMPLIHYPVSSCPGARNDSRQFAARSASDHADPNRKSRN
jgi:hypothetical protein